MRSRVREGIRGGLSGAQIADSVAELFAGFRPSLVAQTITEERRRQRVIDNIMSHDKRKVLDIRSALKCPKSTASIRTHITLRYIDQSTGLERRYFHITTLTGQGRLSDQLNTAIREASQDATNRGYTPPRITSANVTGLPSFRINYIECQ